jgi:hypothetical protein
VRSGRLLRQVIVDADRAMGALVDELPSLQMNENGAIDFTATPAVVLASIADKAQTTTAVIGLGLSAIGNLMACAAPEMEDGTISADTVEALGWLMAELGEMAAVCFVLATLCRQHGCAAGPQDRPNAAVLRAAV